MNTTGTTTSPPAGTEPGSRPGGPDARADGAADSRADGPADGRTDGPAGGPADGAADGAARAAWDLAAEPGAASRARDLTRRTLRRWRVTDPADVDDTVLIVDELVTNAVVHGAGPVRLTLRLDGAHLTGEVADTAPPPGPLPGAAPTEPHVLDWAEAGRGLRLVAALATAYGARPEPPGKTVWFTRRLTPDVHHPTSA